MEVDVGGKDDNSAEAQGPEREGLAISPTPCQRACEDRYAHEIRHVLTHEDIIQCLRVAEEVEPVTDKVEGRVCKEDSREPVPHSSEIPLEDGR